MQKNLLNQKGIAAVGLIVVALIIVGVIIAAIFFILNGNSLKKITYQSNQPSSNSTVLEEEVPFKICETGDPVQCNDPISNSAVDNVYVEAPDQP